MVQLITRRHQYASKWLRLGVAIALILNHQGKYDSTKRNALLFMHMLQRIDSLYVRSAAIAQESTAEAPAAVTQVPTPAPVTPAPAATPVPAAVTPVPSPTAVHVESTPAPAPTTVAPAAPAATPVPTPAPSPTPSMTPAPVPVPVPSPVADSSSSSSASSNDTGVATPTPTPTPTKKKTTAPTPTPTPTPKQTPEPTTAGTTTPKPASTTRAPASSSDTSNTSSSSSGTKSHTVLLAVLAGVGSICIFSLIVLCCRRRHRQNSDSDLDNLPTPVQAAYASNRHQTPATTDVTAGQLPDQKLSISTTGAFAGLPLGENGLPKYAVTSPEMPANYRASARQSRLLDVNRRTRTGTINSATSESNATSFTNAMHPPVHDDGNSSTSSLSIRRDSDMSSTFDRLSYGSQISTSDNGDNGSSANSKYPRITTNLKMNRFSRMSSTTSSFQGNDSDVASFISYDLTSRSGSEQSESNGNSSTNSNGKSWYKSIRSPSEQDRYTAQMDRPSSSIERESFEL
ncbi:hypothetical protein FI667_g8170, partial [Globisporangium splendens]